MNLASYFEAIHNKSIIGLGPSRFLAINAALIAREASLIDDIPWEGNLAGDKTLHGRLMGVSFRAIYIDS